MYTMVLVMSLSLFFLLFFGIMMLGNKMSHTIEYLQAKEADEELEKIEEKMKLYKQKK
ncbi:hypothetical protein JCM9140_4795 [Halalkalibacter wakoensis JCM 9140]|uniref:Uncharacterized protein n=1 Tax=Halalkalibacter wakoensis JCM 9140 TaxID=1236970 RepID=W4Q975_9BACI|nr:hypothetical protein [Halalkalibacter wakoensis]GAE28550.1 hypothetical protein JCM9140_4795 [Halalkalibacter wakoensis JCM 9140]